MLTLYICGALTWLSAAGTVSQGKGEELVALSGIQRVQDNSIFKN